MKYVCELCGYIYDESVGDAERNIAPGTPFRLVQVNKECLICGCQMDAVDGADPIRRDSQR